MDFIHYDENKYRELAKEINLVSQALSEGIVL
jgi:hypothetical protein